MTPRGTDWSLAGLVALLGATGAAVVWAGSPGRGWVFALHDVAGFALGAVLVWKLRRVLPPRRTSVASLGEVGVPSGVARRARSRRRSLDGVELVHARGAGKGLTGHTARMRAAILKEYGTTPEVGEWDDPIADDGQAAVEVVAAGLNPVDLLMASGTYPRGAPPVPSIAGREGIAQTDEGRVYFNAAVPPFGSFAERTLIDPEKAFAVPEGVDPGLALCFGIAGMATWLALEWRAKLRAGETVLVLGASGVVGQIGVQAAKLLGAGRVVAAARSPESLERAKELGADAVVKLDAEDDLAGALREASDGGPDVVIDPLWGDPAVAAIDAAAENARYVQIGSSAGQEIALSAPAFRNKMLVLMGHTNFAAPVDVQRDAFTKMARHGAAGELVAEFEEVPLDDVADAWKRQGESPRRKLVIVPR